MTEPIKREGDSCPRCGSAEVFEGITTESHNGPTHLDVCASCSAVWERETRERPTSEPCTNCAWLPGSREHESGELFGIIMSTIDGDGVFYCHRRVPFDVKDGKETGFEHKIEGRRCTNATVCAGWIQAKLREKRAQRRAAP